MLIAVIVVGILLIIYFIYRLQEVLADKKAWERSLLFRIKLRLYTKLDGMLVSLQVGPTMLQKLEFKSDETLEEIYNLIIRVGVKLEYRIDYSNDIEQIKKLCEIGE